MYTSLNSPPQLTGWKSSGGDPCGESWKGITCEGSAVVSMYECNYVKCKCGFLIILGGLISKLFDGFYCCCNREVSRLGLNGTLGYLLSDLRSLRKL